MTKITREDVEHIARLARLELSDSEVDKFAGELSAITGAIEVLQGAPTDNVEPTLIVNNCIEQGDEDEVGSQVENPAELLKDVAERGGEIVDDQVVVPSVF